MGARALLTALALCSRVLAAPASIFVSPSGSDSSGDGSMSKPFATVSRAQVAVRAVNANMSADVCVYVRGGVYALSEPLTFTPPDSGSNGYYVRYMAYPGDAEPPVLHGGVPVTGWQLANASARVWTARMPVHTRQLYINGDRANRTYHAGGLDGTVGVTSWGYNTTDTAPLTWAATQNVGDIEFLYTGVGSSWTECRCRVASIAALPGGAGSNISMAEPCWTTGVKRFFGQGIGHNCANIENIFDGLSNPGEYYYNSATGVVTYVARPQDNMSAVEAFAASTEVLLVIQGDRTAQPSVQPVQFIAFQGLVFQFGGWNEPSTGVGYIDMQSGFRLIGPNPPSADTTWVPVPGNIQVHTGWNISFVGCTFQHLGATALAVNDGSQNVEIVNNTFTDTSCGGVIVGQVDDCNTTDPTRQNAHVYVYNNNFLNIPVEYRDCAPIVGGFLVNASFVHNSVINSSNTGFSLGWGWSRDECTNAHDNRVISNYVERSNWLLEDGGSFYVLGPQPNSVMLENFSNKQGRLFGSFYPDEGSAYWHLDRNVVNEGQEWLHIWTSSIHNITVTNSWTNQPYQENNGVNISVVNTTILKAGEPFPLAAQAIIDASGVLDSGPKPLTPDGDDLMPVRGATASLRTTCRFCEAP